MKITFVNPRYDPKHPQPPLSLLHLSAVAEQEGWKAEIVDGNLLNLSPRDAANKISSDTDLVGLTGMTPIASYSFKVAKHVKKRLDIPVVMGGPHMTVLPLETMRRVPEIDVGVFGEGENTLRQLLVSTPNSLQSMKGVVYRHNDFLIQNPPRPFIKNLDSLPLPAYHLLEKPLTKYRPFPPHGRKLPFMSMVTSRGCPYRCTFCSHSVWGRVYNCFSAGYVASHVKHLQERYGIKYIQFYDDSFTLKRNRIMQLCKLMEPLHIDWSCETRANLVDDKLLGAMKKAGCQLIGFGLESGSQRILNLLNKQITLEQSRNAVEWCNKLGITTVAYMMLGAPTETETEIEQSIQFVESLPLDYVQWSIVTPYLGTELYEQAKQAGVSLPDRFDDWVYVNLGSVKDGPLISANANLSPEEFRNLHLKAYKQFYLRPKYVLRRLKKMARSTEEVKVTLRGLGMLVGMLKG